MGHIIDRIYVVMGVGEVKLLRKPLRAAAAAARKRILGRLRALQPSLPIGDRVSSVIDRFSVVDIMKKLISC